MPARWTIFCAMIDNFGDIGVCWRLARQLRLEKAINVDLWVDDWPAALRFLQVQAEDGDLSAVGDHLVIAGVDVLRWPSTWPDGAATEGVVADDGSMSERVVKSDRVIEAFGCELPAALKKALSTRQTPLVWINLEYLSAEAWVSGCHALPSPQNLSVMLKKYFFFPGFTQDTGGLLRETNLLARHQAWQADMGACRSRLLADLGIGASQVSVPDLWLSVFAYDSPSMTSWFEALAEGTQTVLCLVPEGKALASVCSFFNVNEALPGQLYQRASLTVVIIPFRSQDQYDHMLSVCDFNLVRGEDSFVRAQWAARPFMWHIYPQEDGVHINKLEAYAGCYLQGLDIAAAEAWLSFARGWNLGEDCRELWHYLRPQLPVLLLHTREWQKKLAVMPDLATNLVNFKTLLN